MIIGLPREVQDNEYRVALTPDGVEALALAGHQVLVEQGAGDESGFSDDEYIRSGARIEPQAAKVWAQAGMVMKVKAPVAQEYPLLRPGLLLYTYLHLAADPGLTQALLSKGVTAIAYETVQRSDGSLPLLTPMSQIAGRMAVQIAAHYLEHSNGGRGKLLGGVPGVRPADVIIIGGGAVGTNAAQIALGMGAHVTVIDINIERLRYLSEILRGNLTTLSGNRRNIADAIQYADAVIGAVLRPGAKAPHLVTREMVATMKPGSVIVDVAVDQGGCVETSRPTTHSNPVFTINGVTHYCVANIPGAVPRTSTYALSNATLPYALRLANLGLARAVQNDPALALGVNTHQGKVTCQAVAAAFGLEYAPLSTLL